MRVTLEMMDPLVALVPQDLRETVVSLDPLVPVDWLEHPDPQDPLELQVALETVENLVLLDLPDLLGPLELEVLLDPLV